MIHILGTGLSGLVGSRVTELLKDGFSFENLSLETGVDITDRAQVDSYFAKSDASWVFHFAAYTDVQGAEKERDRKDQSIAWKINVTATEYIIANCIRYDKKLLYIDTDYAFDGKKKSYTEKDTPNPLGWYGMTKYEGTKRVMTMGENSLIIRIANPYRANPVGKKDFVHKMMERLASGQAITAATDQMFVPTFIDDIAFAIRKLTDAHAHGMFHVVGNSALSPFDAATRIADVFGYDASLIQPSTFKEVFRDRAPAPQYANLKNDKIRSYGIAMSTFGDGLKAVLQQEQSNS